MNSKQRRASGYLTPKSTLKLKPKEIVKNCLEPQAFWDDWTDDRDGFRFPVDNTKLRSRFTFFNDDVVVFNKKLKKKLKIRRVRNRKV